MKQYMEEVCKDAQRYFQKTYANKPRIVTGVVVSLVLFLLSMHYLYDGFDKQFFVMTFLCLMTGILLILPKFENRILQWLTLLLYLGYVPGKMFERIELPLQDLSTLRDGARLVNLFIILFLYALILFLSQRVSIAFSVSNGILLAACIANYYVKNFRGTSLTLNDILAVRTAATVVGNYNLTMEPELWYTILYFIFFIAWGRWCQISGRGIRYHIITTTVSLLSCLLLLCFYYKTDYLEEHELKNAYWNTGVSEELNGFLLTFVININEMRLEKPAGYSEGALLAIAEEAGKNYTTVNESDFYPNIIFIMNEAWSDLRVLGNIETSEEVMPFVDSLADCSNAKKGNTHVEILGGLTANSEFEALTGDSLAFLAAGVVPYQLQVNHNMSSLATVLSAQGYHTMAMHPSVSSAWNREKVYEYLGFDDFIDINEFETEYRSIGNFISDECNFNEIIYRFEHKEDGPLFLFDITIQNHADYYGQISQDIQITKVGSTLASEMDSFDIYQAETYINLMHETDRAFQALISYFETVEEPTIICMYGDHEPWLSDGIYDAFFEDSSLTEEEQNDLKYVTPYVIWSNTDTVFPDVEDLSANYLGTVVLETAGVELSAYHKFLSELYEDYPVITLHNIESIEDDERIVQYQMLEYNQLMEKDYLEELFLP